jgi:hypothetical protein
MFYLGVHRPNEKRELAQRRDDASAGFLRLPFSLSKSGCVVVVFLLVFSVGTFSNNRAPLFLAGLACSF